MKHCLFIVLFIGIASSAFADKALIANCREGKGCKFELTDYEAGIHSPDVGRDIGPNDIIVCGKMKNGEVIFYVDNKSREQIDRQWGGDGYTQIGLFNPYIQPKSGLWKVTYGNSTGNECYGIGNIGTFVRGKISPGLTTKGNLNFNYPFNPYKLFPSAEMKWKKSGYDTYKGILDFNQGISSPMKMHYNVHILNEENIETVYTIEIKVPTKEPCFAKIPVNFKLIREKKINDELPDMLEDEEDLLPVESKGNQDDLLEVKSQGELLPVNSKNKKTTDVPKLEDKQKTEVPRIEDKPKTNVLRVN